MNHREMEKWLKLREDIYIAAVRHNGPENPEQLLEQATAAANEIFWQPYYRILKKYKGAEALKKLLELDGVPAMLRFYLEYENPLLAFGNDTKHFFHAAQDAVRRFYSGQIK